MSDRAPSIRRPPGSANRAAILLAAGAVIFVFALALDQFVFQSLRFPRARHHDWYRALRIAGYLPVWFAIGAAAFLHQRSRCPATGARQGAFIALSATAGGLTAEALKMLIRRQRPLETGEYVFRSYLDAPFSSSNLGLPSSHTLIAFAGALAMARLMPAAAPVWLLWATGCAVTRVVDGSHFLSDAALGATVAVPVSWSVARLLRVEGAP